jgi:uncharacterized Rmd1/YagE family protein
LQWQHFKRTKTKERYHQFEFGEPDLIRQTLSKLLKNMDKITTYSPVDGYRVKKLFASLKRDNGLITNRQNCGFQEQNRL